MDGAVLRRYAELIVRHAANVQPGQIVSIGSSIGKEELTREVAAEAYRSGAKFVDVFYWDSELKRIRAEYADPDTLEYVPPWYGERLLALGREHAARIGLSPFIDPGALDGVDPARAGRDALPFLKETSQVISERTTNWAGVPCPVPAWARVVHPDLDEDAALEKLWDEIIHVCRLDEEDPVAAWNERQELLLDLASRLTERRFDALHFEGPGTDFTVGLLPTSTWIAARAETVDGIRHMPNLPSEEIFTAPDPERADGVVRSTKPLALTGTVVRGLTVRFEGGRAVEIEADAGAEALRARAGKDEGASRLGEVALVDRESRIGRLGTVFYDTLLDENAASHLALGNAYTMSAGEEDHERLNVSQIHVDFMIGSDEVGVTGLTASGERVPILRDGAWQI